MKVLHVTTVSQSLAFLQGQLSFFRDRGLEVWVASRPDERLLEFAEQEGATPVGIQMARQINPLADLKSVAMLASEIRKIRPIIVHSHTPKGGLIGTIAARISRVPIVIYHIRGLPYMEMTGWRRLLMKRIEWLSCKLADEVFCVSHSIAEVAVNDKLVRKDKIKVFLNGSGNGVDSQVRFSPARFDEEDRQALREELRIPGDAIFVLFVGRLAVDKGINELASAWKVVSHTCSSAHLVIVGSPDERDPILPTTLADLGVTPRVHLVGNQSDIAPFYWASDMLVLPTYREGFPNVLLEAAAMALPVIATRVPGCIDAVIHGETGDLIPAKDVDSLAASILAMVSDVPRRLRYSAAGRDRIERFFDSRSIWQAIYEEYIRLQKQI